MIIEKVSNSGVVLEHFQFNSGSIRIGRAYDNDLILHDVHVDGSHLKLSYDEEREGFWFVDLGTLNGTQLVRSKENRHRKVPANFICSGDILCLGKTLLKVRSRVQDVPAAIKISGWDKLLSLSGRIWFVVLQCVLLVGLETLNQFYNEPREDKLGSKFLEAIDVLFVVIAYAVVWAFIARVQKAEPRIWVHASLIAWCLLLVSIFDLTQGVIFFNLQLADYAAFINLIFNSLCIFVIVWASLYLATELKKGLRFLLAMLVPFGLVLSMVVSIIQRPDFRPYPEYDSLVVPPAWQWVDGISRDEYVEATAGLYRAPKPEELAASDEETEDELTDKPDQSNQESLEEEPVE